LQKGEVALLIRPLGDKVVVKPSESEETTAGGIVLPDTAKKKPQEGEVVAVGPGKILDDGSRKQPSVEVGQIVIYAKYGGNEVRVDGEDYIILDEDSIYCVRE
jgi:chaperonin GroES